MKFISEVLHGIEDIYVYLDDIICFSQDKASHLKTVEEVFARLAKYGLALALPKCEFEQQKVEFLGYEVSKNGVRPLEYKLEAIDKFEKPATQKLLLRFLGMLNFYRKAIPNLQKDGKSVTPAAILQPLYTAAGTAAATTAPAAVR